MKTEVQEENAETSNASRTGRESNGSKPAGNKEEMMKKMQAAGQPGAEHKALDAFEGEWDAEVKCWGQPGGQADVTHATAKTSWIFGGRFLEEDFHGEMMGKPFTGRYLLGFDNTKKKFNSMWVDDVSTAIMVSEGKGEQGNKVITLEGKADCPGTGQKDVPMKQVLRVMGPDKHVMEMFNDGQKTMEITYTRQ